MKQQLIISIVAILLFGYTIESKAQPTRKEQKQQAFEELKSLVETGSFQFTGKWAYPQRGGQVDLTTRDNFLRIKEGQVSADMPYFGQVTGGGAGYGGVGGGIVFEGEIKDYQVKTNDKKGRLTISFKTNSAAESFNCTFSMSSKTSVSLSITSSYRQIIRYLGAIESIE